MSANEDREVATVSDEEEDDEDEELLGLNGEICQQRVDSFVAVTSTDQALAQFYLQQHQWDLDRSVNAYFESVGGGEEGGGGVAGSVTPSAVIVSKPIAESEKNDGPGGTGIISLEAVAEACLNAQASTVPPNEFRMVSWNIDGLDNNCLNIRTNAVIEVIQAEKPNIVFLQEVIQATLSVFETKLPEYEVFSGGDDGDYFVATLLRRFTVYHDSAHYVPFTGSRMNRGILCVHAHIGELKLTLLNTHLESTKDHAEERVRQLKQLFKTAQGEEASRCVLLGGDLNLRDKELYAIGGVPRSLFDLWEACGKRKECMYTWDMKRNSNNNMEAKWAPRMRFDRMYLRNPLATASVSVKPIHFGLLGLEKAKGSQRFPSDHWALHLFFERVGATNGAAALPVRSKSRIADYFEAKGAAAATAAVAPISAATSTAAANQIGESSGSGGGSGSIGDDGGHVNKKLKTDDDA